MLLPQSHAWTPRQKALILLAVLVGLVAFVGIVYGYERYYRGLREADLVGTWTRVDSGSGGGYYEFRRDGTMVMLGDDGQPTSIKGKWYAGGANIYVRFPPNDRRDWQLVVWHIVDISRDEFRVRVWQDDKGLAVWRRMKPIARSPVDLSDIPTAQVEDVNP